MKKIITLLLVIILSVSCIINFTAGSIHLVDTLLEGQFVVSLAFDSDGTAWAGIIRDQYGLVKINPDGSTEIFDHTNSCLVDSANIWDMDIDSEGNLWMLNEGLIRYDGDTFTKWDTINDGQLIILAYNHSLAIDGNDNIWCIATNPYINCLNFQLICFDGENFTAYEPSSLSCGTSFPVTDIAIDKLDNKWLSFRSYNEALVFLKFGEGEWTAFDTTDIGFAPYQISDIEFDSDNNLWFNDDITYSSMYYEDHVGLYCFDGENVAIGFGSNHLISEICIDNADNVWFSGFSPHLGVLDMNHKWAVDDSDDVGFCRVMEMGPNGDMWLGTSTGIMIYRYSQAK
jgi:ligand-binding sensor domain-containing protein